MKLILLAHPFTTPGLTCVNSTSRALPFGVGGWVVMFTYNVGF